MFHHRWAREVDQRCSAGRIARMRAPKASEGEHTGFADQVRARMVDRVWFVGSNETNAPQIESGFQEMLGLLNEHLAKRLYLFGGRPAFGDFGLWGQFYELWTDPTTGALIEGNAPHVLDWVHRMLWPRAQGAFESWTALAPTLMPILTKQVGKQFWPWTLANERALAEGAEEFSVTLADKVWTQKPQKYHARSLAHAARKICRNPRLARSRHDPGRRGLPRRNARLDTKSRRNRGQRAWQHRPTRPHSSSAPDQGLSASLARLFAREGIRVALAARKIEKLGELCTATGAKAFACDATNAEEVERLFGLVEREIATPDIVVYNASGRARGPFVDLAAADVAQAIAVSAFGGFLVAQQAAKRMLPNKHGAILFTGASASVKGYAQSAPFAMGKFALRGLAQSMARELSPQGIHVGHFVIDGGIRSAARSEPADQAGLDARSRCDCGELLAPAAAAAQRLDLGDRIAAVGGEVLRHRRSGAMRSINHRCAIAHRGTSRLRVWSLRTIPE